MAHPEVDNRTPLAFELLHATDEQGAPTIVPIVKATYEIRAGAVHLAENQRPVNLSGEPWGRAECPSWKYEPEGAPSKPGTDVVLVGSACAPRAVTRDLEVSFRAGTMQQVVRVFGDRRWVKRLGGGIGMTDPEPFDRVPLVWERAFGGWDRTDPDPARHTFEPRNPVGVGFHAGRGSFVEGSSAPNLEDPSRLVSKFTDRPPPVGFGFVGPSWKPRSDFAGTYDGEWMRSRMPLLPTDFDRRFYNAAPVPLISATKLRGGESVAVSGATRDGNVSFRLPRVPPPRLTLTFAGRRSLSLEGALDTVIVNTDEALLFLLWRPELPAPATPHPVRNVCVDVEGVPLHSC